MTTNISAHKSRKVQKRTNGPVGLYQRLGLVDEICEKLGNETILMSKFVKTHLSSIDKVIKKCDNVNIMITMSMEALDRVEEGTFQETAANCRTRSKKEICCTMCFHSP